MRTENKNQYLLFSFLFAAVCFALIGKAWGETLEEISSIDTSFTPHIVHEVKAEQAEEPKGEYFFTGEISAYNAGDPAQTDASPCISAAGVDVCALLEAGVTPCAFNGVKFWTVLNIEGVGKCIVLDRTSKKYAGRVDLAFKKDQRREAIIFGVKRRDITILYKP